MSIPRLQSLLQETPLQVTGMGAWSAGGNNVQELWQSVHAGKGLAGWLRLPEAVADGKLPVCTAATPKLTHPALRHLRRMDRAVMLAAAAAWEAWLDAGLETRPASPDRIAVVVGTSRGTVQASKEAQRQLDAGRMFPSTAAHATLASLSGVLAAMCQATGPCLVVSAACASSATALTTAAQLILSGAVDVALAGGAEAPLDPVILAQLHAAGVLATHTDPALACRPFDRHRSGTVLGEGAAFLVLESTASVQRRNAAAYAQFAGWGIATEPGERAGVSEDSRGLTTAMQKALCLAGLSTTDIGYLNPHGTGTKLNDLQEARAILQVFANSPGPLVSATKPVTGHCMGATAALEAIIAIQVLRQGIAPPTGNCADPDPGCSLRLIHERPAPCVTQAVMTNSSGFWGNHASLLFTRTNDRT